MSKGGKQADRRVGISSQVAFQKQDVEKALRFFSANPTKFSGDATTVLAGIFDFYQRWNYLNDSDYAMIVEIVEHYDL